MRERREILFRGQTRRKGEKVRISGEPVDSNWVYGGIFPGEGDFSIIYQTKPKIEKFTVYSDTVGQFTGLTDKNGTRIFEGDIVKYKIIGLNAFGKMEKRETKSIVKYNAPCFSPFETDLYEDYVMPEEAEIIGNIYDNPELLKGD